MIAYTGLETISNLAEETRDPPRDVPLGVQARRRRRLRHLPDPAGDRALGAAGPRGGRRVHDAARRAPRGGRLPERPDPRRRREPRPRRAASCDGLEIYVGVLAATILFIATNAGVIGASRITYAMATLPPAARRSSAGCTRASRRRGWRSSSSPAIVPIATLLPGQTTFLGTMYSFGAMLSFTIAHAAIVALRVRGRDEELPYKARPNLRLRGIDWPRVRDPRRASAPALAWLVVVVQEPATRWVGLGWLVLGFAGYAALPAAARPAAGRDAPRARARARAVADDRVPDDRRPGRALERVGGGARRGRAPGRRARARRSPSSTCSRCRCRCRSRPSCPSSEAEADELLDDAVSLVEAYGVRAFARLARGRSAGAEIVREAEQRGAELIALGARRQARAQRDADLRPARPTT